MIKTKYTAVWDEQKIKTELKKALGEHFNGVDVFTEQNLIEAREITKKIYERNLSLRRTA